MFFVNHDSKPHFLITICQQLINVPTEGYNWEGDLCFVRMINNINKLPFCVHIKALASLAIQYKILIEKKIILLLLCKSLRAVHTHD